MVSTEEPLPHAHQVWIISDNASAARSRLDALRKAGYDKALLYASGSLRHRISLGVFADSANAQRLSETLRQQGFEARIEPLLTGC